MSDQKRDKRIETNKDFIVSRKHNNSLASLLTEYPQGVPDDVICRVLQLTPSELKVYYDGAMGCLKSVLDNDGAL